MTETHWVGLDVGDRRTAVCILSQAGTMVAEKEVASTAEAVIAVLADAGAAVGATLAMEAGSSDHLARTLREQGQTVIVFEARQAHSFLQISRNKTDASDARGLADLARIGRTKVSHVHQRGRECRRIRVQLRLRESLIKQRFVAENALRQTLRNEGARLGEIYSSGGVRVAYRAAIAGLPASVRNAVDADLRSFVAIATDLRRILGEQDRRLNRMARTHPICRRLMTIPGVGFVTALSFYSAIEDPSRFSKVDNVAAYLGLTPRIAQSGATRRGGRISKMGSKLTRAHLYNAANVLLVTARAENDLKAWGTALRGRIGLPKARIAVARKLAIVMTAVWRSDGDFVASISRDASKSAKESSPHPA